MHSNETFHSHTRFEETEEVEEHDERDERTELIEESIENFRLKPFVELNRVAKIISSLYFTGKPEHYINFPDPRTASLERLKDTRPDMYFLTPEASGEIIQRNLLDMLHSIKVEIPPQGRLTPRKLDELSNVLRQILKQIPEL